MAKRIPQPTVDQSASYQLLYNWFLPLFPGGLEPCLLILSRRKNCHGHYTPAIWSADGKSAIAEIALNPDTLNRDWCAICSTLVHEMCHHWRQHNGKPPRPAYHDHAWAAQMERVGLTPTSTGEPGGRKVGQHMTHLVVDGGPFHKRYLEAPATLRLPWVTVARLDDGSRPRSSTPSKVKYSCLCSNVWGKPGLHLSCLVCMRDLVGADEDSEEV